MPNHFHLLVLVKEVELPRAAASQGLRSSQGLTQSQTLTTQTLTARSLNDSIGIVLRSYTRAINKQENSTGSLFRKNTKAECVTCPDGLSPSWFVENGVTTYFNTLPGDDYPQVCFDYIHQNPVKAGLVKIATDWEFSSAQDYNGIRNIGLINRKVAKEFGLINKVI
jgi:putative transposase